MFLITKGVSSKSMIDMVAIYLGQKGNVMIISPVKSPSWTLRGVHFLSEADLCQSSVISSLSDTSSKCTLRTVRSLETCFVQFVNSAPGIVSSSRFLPENLSPQTKSLNLLHFFWFVEFFSVQTKVFVAGQFKMNGWVIIEKLLHQSVDFKFLKKQPLYVIGTWFAFLVENHSLMDSLEKLLEGFCKHSNQWNEIWISFVTFIQIRVLLTGSEITDSIKCQIY